MFLKFASSQAHQGYPEEGGTLLVETGNYSKTEKNGESQHPLIRPLDSAHRGLTQLGLTGRIDAVIVYGMLLVTPHLPPSVTAATATIDQ